MSDYRVQVLQDINRENRAKLRHIEWQAGNAWGEVRKAFEERAADLREEIKDVSRQIRGEGFTYES